MINKDESEEYMKFILDYIKKNNKNNKYDDLLRHLEIFKRPNVGNILDYIKYNNQDKKYDELIAFLVGQEVAP